MKLINILPNLDIILWGWSNWGWERGFLCYDRTWRSLPQMHYIHAGPVEIRWWKWDEDVEDQPAVELPLPVDYSVKYFE